MNKLQHISFARQNTDNSFTRVLCRRPFENQKKNENVCTRQLYVACARRLFQTVIHAGHIVRCPHRSTQVSVKSTAVASAMYIDHR